MQSVQSHFNQKSTVIDQILLTSRFEDVPLLASNVLFRQFEKFFAFAACSSNAGGPGLGWLSPISKHLILNLVVSIQCYHDFFSFCPHRPTRARLRAWVCLITIAIAHARHANAGEAAGVDGNLCCENCSTAPSFPVLQWVLQCG